jgi:hypothetical protein
MTSLHQELVNLWQFFQAIFICLCMTGLITVPVILWGYETVTKRRI